MILALEGVGVLVRAVVQVQEVGVPAQVLVWALVQVQEVGVPAQVLVLEVLVLAQELKQR
jgi:hypothetical protein